MRESSIAFMWKNVVMITQLQALRVCTYIAQSSDRRICLSESVEIWKLENSLQIYNEIERSSVRGGLCGEIEPDLEGSLCNREILKRNVIHF